MDAYLAAWGGRPLTDDSFDTAVSVTWATLVRNGYPFSREYVAGFIDGLHLGVDVI